MSETDSSDGEDSPESHLRSSWNEFNSSVQSLRTAVYSWLQRRGFIIQAGVLFLASYLLNELFEFVIGLLPTLAEVGRTVPDPEISNTSLATLVVIVSLANWILIRRNLNVVRDEISTVSNSGISIARTDGGESGFDWPAFLIGAGLGGLIATEFAPDFVVGAAFIGGFLALWYFPENG